MHGTQNLAQQLLENAAKTLTADDQVVHCVPYVYLQQAASMLAPAQFGAQSVSSHAMVRIRVKFRANA